jgi:hypothetical protein
MRVLENRVPTRKFGLKIQEVKGKQRKTAEGNTS